MEPTTAKEKLKMKSIQRRKDCVLKKAYELSTLCDVQVCVIALVPKQSDDHDPQVETWPPNPNTVKLIIDNYRRSFGFGRTNTKETTLDLTTDTAVSVGQKRKRDESVQIPKPMDDDLMINQLSFDQLMMMNSSIEATLRRIDAIEDEYRDALGVTSGSFNLLNSNNTQWSHENQVGGHQQEDLFPANYIDLNLNTNTNTQSSQTHQIQSVVYQQEELFSGNVDHMVHHDQAFYPIYLHPIADQNFAFDPIFTTLHHPNLRECY